MKTLSQVVLIPTRILATSSNEHEVCAATVSSQEAIPGCDRRQGCAAGLVADHAHVPGQGVAGDPGQREQEAPVPAGGIEHPQRSRRPASSSASSLRKPASSAGV